MERRRPLGLDADHPRRARRGDRNARDEAAAADRHDDGLDVGEILQDLEPDRSLPRDRQRIVERVHERPSGLLEQDVQPLERLARIGRLEIDRGTVATRRRDLRLAGAAPHDDQRVEAFLRCSPRNRLRVVTGRDRDDALGLLVVRQRRELRQHPARLERAGALQELGLEECVWPERPAREQRRAMQPPADDLRGAFDVAALDPWNHADDRTREAIARDCNRRPSRSPMDGGPCNSGHRLDRYKRTSHHHSSIGA